MRHLLPALALMGSFSFTLSAEAMDPPAPPAPPVPPAMGGAPGTPEGSGTDRRALMKEMMDLEAQIRPIREKVQQDPELIKAKTAADDARKAVRTKEDELMAVDPAFAALKVKRDALFEKMAAAGMDPNRPGKKDKEGKEGKGGKEGKPGKDRPEADASAPLPAPKL